MLLPKLIVAMFLAAGIFFLILLRRRILNGKLPLRRQISFWTLAGGVLLMYFPCMTDYMILGEETAFHLSQIASLIDSPYGFLSLPTLLHRSGFSLMAAYKSFILLSLSMTAVLAHQASLCMTDDSDMALAGSLLYLVNPYYLKCLYVTGDATRFTVYTFLPLLVSLLCRMPPLRRMFLPLCRQLQRIPISGRKTALLILAAFAIIVTIYQSNRLSYESYPYYIYSAQDISAQAAERSH